MRFILIAQVYWPVWLTGVTNGLPCTGAAVGALVVVAGWRFAWWLEFRE